MTTAELITEAEGVVARVQRKLPVPIRDVAKALPVVFHDWASEEILGEEFEPDILGLFVGDPLALSGATETAAHILIFVESVWDFSGGDVAVFREELRLTYLHELGHYLGWDEEDLAERGLE